MILHNRYRQRGGEDTSTENEARLLHDHGHEVFAWFEDNRSFADRDLLRVGLDAVWSRRSYRKTRSRIASFKPDLISVHNLFPLLSPSVLSAAEAEHVPIVQTLHNFRLLCPAAGLFRKGAVCESCVHRFIPWPGLYHGCYRNSRLATVSVTGMALCNKALGTRTHSVLRYLVPSRFAREKFIEAGFAPDKIAVQPNFLARDPGLGFGRGGFALFTGRLTVEKGLHSLLEAWRQLRSPIPLRIVGGGPLEKDLTQAVKEFDRVELLGFQDVEQTYALIGAASFVVVPSICYETFGRVVIESFAMGTPVIASNLGALPELVDHGRTGLLFRPGDPDDLADKIEWMLSHPAETARMRREARAEFLAKYTPEQNYRSLMEIYQKVLEGKDAASQPRAAAMHAAGHAD